jgi:hypothetical protein
LLVLCYLCSDEKEEEDWRRSLLLPERKGWEGEEGRWQLFIDWWWPFAPISKIYRTRARGNYCAINSKRKIKKSGAINLITTARFPLASSHLSLSQH